METLTLIPVSIANSVNSFQQISPNTVISSPNVLLQCLLHVLRNHPESDAIPLLKMVFRYIGIEDAVVSNAELRKQHQTTHLQAVGLRDHHIYYSIHSYWKNRYKIFHNNIAKDDSKILYKYSIDVPSNVRRLTSVFQKRTIYFDRHYFNLLSNNFKIPQLNMLYFNSSYRQFIDNLVSTKFGKKDTELYKPKLGNKRLPHKIIGQLHQPSDKLIRYVNKQNNNWQIVHPPLDMGQYSIRHIPQDNLVQCVFQSVYYRGMKAPHTFQTDQLGMYINTFSVIAGQQTIEVPQKFVQDDKQMIYLWPSPRNTQRILIQNTSQNIGMFKSFQHINERSQLFSYQRSKDSIIPAFQSVNYRSWIYAELHRGVYPQFSQGSLDGIVINPAWYSHAYVPYDTFRGVYKNRFITQINTVDPSDIPPDAVLVDSDARLTGLIKITGVPSQSVVQFGTKQQILRRTNNLTNNTAYNSEYQLNQESQYYQWLSVDYNQYPPMSNVIVIPSHQNDPDFNSELTHNEGSLLLRKFYHPDRYICIPDKINSLTSGGNKEKQPDHISVLEISKFGYRPSIDSDYDTYGVSLRGKLRDIKNDIWGWSAGANANTSQQQAKLYRVSANISGYNPYRSYGSLQYYPDDTYDIELLGNSQSYKNTNTSIVYQSWIQYVENSISNIRQIYGDAYSNRTYLAAESFLKRLNWASVSLKQQQNIRVVSWYNSLIMSSKYGDSVIDTLNSQKLDSPYLFDKMGYYNSLIPNYLLSQQNSIISDSCYGDKDYRVWKYYQSQSSLTYSNIDAPEQFWNYTYSNTAFSQQQGNTNLFSVIYTDQNVGDNYGFMNQIGVYEVTFKLKFGYKERLSVQQYNYNNGNNQLIDKYVYENGIDSFISEREDFLRLFSDGVIKVGVLPYSSAGNIDVVLERGTTSVMPSQYQYGYKRLVGYFNTQLDKISFTNSTMCCTTQSEFKFMFQRYGQYSTHMTNNTQYFQYDGKSYLDTIYQSSVPIILGVSEDNWTTVRMQIKKKYQGTGILSWMYFQNIGNFLSGSKYIGIKDTQVVLTTRELNGQIKV